jgi:hypothetical protein
MQEKIDQALQMSEKPTDEEVQACLAHYNHLQAKAEDGTMNTEENALYFKIGAWFKEHNIALWSIKRTKSWRLATPEEAEES